MPRDPMHKFVHTLLHPDQEEEGNGERAEVAKAANILQVGEFQLLQLAYHKWHGEDLPTALVDRLFAAYMLRDIVPIWARHYARGIVEDDACGLINANDPFYHRYDHNYVTHVPQGIKRFCLAALTLIVLVGGGLWLGNEVAENPAGILPPYFDQEDLPRSDGVDKLAPPAPVLPS
jgi:hypothetical protein